MLTYPWLKRRVGYLRIGYCRTRGQDEAGEILVYDNFQINRVCGLSPTLNHIPQNDWLV